MQSIICALCFVTYVLPQRAATLRLQWRHIGFPSSTAFPSSAALNPKWSQTGDFALLFLTILYSAIAKKSRENVRLPPDTLCCLIRIRVLVRNMADLTADARIREIDFSTEPTGSQWALGSCATPKNVHSKDDAWHFRKKQK